MNPFVYGLIFAKWFTIVALFMNRFVHSPFVQETKFYEPIYEPIHMKACVEASS